MTLFHGSVFLPCILALSWYMNFFNNMSETFKSEVVIVNFHGSVILPYCIKAERCMGIKLCVKGQVWPYV